jgi:SAM-dependent methyltransferase
MPRKCSFRKSFAGVYDILYDNPLFYARRTDFILSALGPEGGLLLDAGCATGRQIEELQARGRAVIGLDNDRHMLTVASCNSFDAPLVCGDLRRLPFRAAFAGILCLESPLAYLLDEDDFLMALGGLRRALLPGGRLILDAYDYVRMFWPTAMGRMRTFIDTVRVIEWHEYDERTRIWTMNQRFAVDDEDGRTRRFEVTHRLKMRTPDEYAAALERTGFEIREMLDGYPGSPDQRILIVASAR